MRSLLRSLLCLIPLLLGGWSHGTGKSTIGINESKQSFAASDQMFLNAMKMASFWWLTLSSGGGDTGEESYVASQCLDANLYPTQLPCPGATLTGGTGGVSSTTLVVTAVTGTAWVNGIVTGTGIGANVTITAQLSGAAGGPGNYQLSAPVTVTNGTSITEAAAFSKLSFTVYTGMSAPYFPSGNWVILYDGAGTIAVGNGATITNSCFSSCPGGANNRLIVSTSNPGWEFDLTATTPGNTIKNIRIVSACGGFPPAGCVDSTSSTVGTKEALLNAGEIFEPWHIAKMKWAATLRFMDWGATINTAGPFPTWTSRPMLGQAFWSLQPPYETWIALCNRVAATCHLNMPCHDNNATADSFVTSFAQYARDNLNSGLKVLTEYCNEIWNNNYFLLSAAGLVQYPSCPNSFACSLDWGIWRAVRTGQLFSSIMGSSRVIRALGGQNGFISRNQYIMGFTDSMDGGSGTHFSGTAASNSDVLLTAPYVGPFVLPIAWTADPDLGYGKYFQENTYGGVLPGAITGDCGMGVARLCPNPGFIYAAAVAAGGSGYTNGAQVLTASGGTCSVQPQLNVTVTGNAVASVNSIANVGACTVLPTNPVATTGGGGTGAQLNLSFTATHVRATSGQSLAATPPNGTCLQIGIDFLSNPNAPNDLQVDGGNIFPIMDPTGSPVGQTQLTATATTAAGGNVLTFASVPSGVLYLQAFDVTRGGVVTSNPVVQTTSTTVTLRDSVSGAGVQNGDTIGFQYGSYSVGVVQLPWPNGPPSNTTFCFTNAIAPVTTVVNSASATNPLIINVRDAGIVKGSSITISGATGMTNLNGTFTIADISSGTTNLAINVDATTWGTLTNTPAAVASGATTAGWRVNYNKVAGGVLGQTISQWNDDKNTAASFGIGLAGYEGGQQFLDFGGEPSYANWQVNTYNDARMGQLYKDFWQQIAKINPGKPFSHYHFVGQFSNFGSYGLLQNILQPNFSEFEKTKNFHNFLLRRDLGHANDNAPAFINQVA